MHCVFIVFPYFAGTEEAEKLAETIKANWTDNKEMLVTVVKAMGDEMINSLKVKTDGEK